MGSQDAAAELAVAPSADVLVVDNNDDEDDDNYGGGGGGGEDRPLRDALERLKMMEDTMEGRDYEYRGREEEDDDDDDEEEEDAEDGEEVELTDALLETQITDLRRRLAEDDSLASLASSKVPTPAGTRPSTSQQPEAQTTAAASAATASTSATAAEGAADEHEDEKWYDHLAVVGSGKHARPLHVIGCRLTQETRL